MVAIWIVTAMQLSGTLPEVTSVSHVAPLQTEDQYRPGMIVGAVMLNIIKGPMAARLMSKVCLSITCTSVTGDKTPPWKDPVDLRVK
jgi:hypothetical protein